MSILELPHLYNLRFIVAGDQRLTHEFILDNYKRFKCHSVLDVGCGTGDFAPLFLAEEYLGIDIDSRYVAYAKRHYSYHFVCSDILEYNLNNQRFDATILISTLHHLSDTQVNQIFNKVIKITNKIIIIVDLNPDTSLIKKLLINLDRGKYVRTTKEKINLLTPFGRIIHISHFSTGLASQTGMVLLPNYGKK